MYHCSLYYHHLLAIYLWIFLLPIQQIACLLHLSGPGKYFSAIVDIVCNVLSQYQLPIESYWLELSVHDLYLDHIFCLDL